MESMTITVTLEQANTILQGLGELPAKQSMGLIQTIQRQYQEQQAAKQPVETAEPVEVGEPEAEGADEQ